MIAGMAAAGIATSARAQTQPLRLFVGFPAGGSVDTVARRLAEEWRGALGQVLVVNTPGAGGRIAIDQLRTQPTDGRTLLLTPSGMLTIYPHVYQQSLRYRPDVDLIPIAPVCRYSFGFGVGPSVPAEVRDVAGFLAWARTQRNPSYASPAAGSAPHFLGDQLAKLSGVELTHIGYRGAAPAVADVTAGQVPSMIGVLGDLLPQVAGGRMRLIAQSGEGRNRYAPDVPSFAEQGFPALVRQETFGLQFAAGTPEAAVRQIAEATTRALQAPAAVELFTRLALETVTMSPAAYRQLLETERQAWAPIVAASGFKPED
jgi:tripartite-type tricarboxylate transporter receptor subunit TctC